MSKPSIPAWQRTATTDPPTLSADEEPKPENAAEDSTKAVAEEPTTSEGLGNDAESTVLLDQAKRFLEDPNIRNAPREKKAVFLQAKGVSSEDIETLLGNPIQRDASPDLEEAGARAWSTVRTTLIARITFRTCKTDNCRHLLNQYKHRLHRHHNLGNYHLSSHIQSFLHRQRSHRR